MTEPPHAGDESKDAGLGWLLRKLVAVRAGETPALFLAWAYFFCLLTINYILRPLREQQGLVGGQEALAVNFLGTFGGMLVANPLYAWIVTRWPRRKFIPFVHRFLLSNLLVFYLVTRSAPESWQRGIAWAFFVWVSVFNLFVIAVFWSLMADLFDLEEGKRLFGFVSVGGTLGAITGASITAWLARSIPPVHLLLVAAIPLELSVHAMRRLVHLRGMRDEIIPSRAERARSKPRTPEAAGPIEEMDQGGVFTGIALVFRSSYLAWICLYMLLGSISGTILYFEQAGIVSAATSNKGEQTAIFARIDLWVNLVTLVIQLFFTGRIVKRIGIGPTLLLQCLGFGLALVILGTSPTLGVLALSMVLFRTGHYATSRPAREVLFTMVGREAKYKSKGFIDTFVYRGGDAIGAYLKIALSSLGGLGSRGVAFAALPIALVWSLVALTLGRKQIELARSRARAAPLPRAESVR